MKFFSAKGRAASHLRGRKYDLVRRYKLPQTLIGGSLNLSSRKCGRANCRCATADGHPNTTWSSSYQGVRQTHRVPREWYEDIDEMMQSSQELIAAIEELMAINAKLFGFDLEARRAKKRTSVSKKSMPTGKKRSTSGAKLRSLNRVC